MSAALFQSIFESAPDAVVIVDERAAIILVNARTEQLFGYARTELIGERIEVIAPGYVAGSRELQGRRKDNSEFPIEIRTSPVASDGDALASLTMRDVTDRKAASEAASRELEAFTYSIAHDLRAPLRGIHGYSAVLVEELGARLDGQSKEYLERIGASAERMGKLIDALLGLARVNRSELVRETVNLSQLAMIVIAELRASEPARSVEIVIEEGLHARADALLLRVLFDNLLGNAWKFGAKREDACIEFGCEPATHATPTFYVRDNGAGFSMDYVDRLFTPFQRLHSSDEFPGTGMGLATARRIIQRHDGRIWAEAAVDRGATFRFTLE